MMKRLVESSGLIASTTLSDRNTAMFSISMPLMGSVNEAVVVNPASTRPDEFTHNYSSEEAVILRPHSGTYDSLMTSKELGSSTEI